LIEVDGSMMEGGGQVLRMAVTYSAVLGTPIRVSNIRAGREEPGLRPQHLTTLKAVAEMCRAETRGLSIGSMEIELYPGSLRGGNYDVDIGTAGSVSLLLQCLAPIAAFAGSSSRFTIRGGTNVRWSPPIMIMENVIWEAFRVMGFEGKVAVRREGFYPRGGGLVEVEVSPVAGLAPLVAQSPGKIRLVKGISLCGRLPQHIAERQATSARKVLEEYGFETEIITKVERRGEASFSPGSAIGLWVDSSPRMFMGSSALGKRGKPAERVGEEAAVSLVEQIETEAAVDMHTADNLVLWCSLASGESVYSMSRLTPHTETAVEIARMFTDARMNLEVRGEGVARLRCRGVGLENRRQV
jgi:RNA 3'-phosphate cyclase